MQLVHFRKLEAPLGIVSHRNFVALHIGPVYKKEQMTGQRSNFEAKEEDQGKLINFKQV